MEILWRVSLPVSILHAADLVRRGCALANERLFDAVREPVAKVQAAVLASGWPENPLWRHLTAHAADFENHRELAEICVRKAVGRSPQAGLQDLVTALDHLRASVREAFPRLDEELRLRLRPLQEQWESRGPGLLRGIARRTDERILVPRAEIFLVQPALGAGGAAQLASNRVRIEAVLAHPLPHLPETVRLGWLLSQLSLDLPIFADAIHGERLCDVAALAMVPATLAAASDVEWIGERPGLLAEAMRVWACCPPDDSAALAEIVENWWETYLAVPTDWAVALTALDRMLPPLKSVSV